MKILRGKSIFGLMYALLLAIPMVSAISKVIYVQSNKNAYKSYSDNVNTNEYVNIDNLPFENVNFTFRSNLMDNTYYPSSTRPKFYVANIEYIDGNLTNTLKESLLTTSYIKLWYDNGSYISWNNANTNLYGGTYSFTIKCDVLGYGDFTNTDTSLLNIFFYNINQSNPLDNVFEYAIDETIKDNNYGKIDFLSWFNNMFLDNNTDVNNRYTRYVNWYLNYTMFISCAYLLFLVLMWFINFARKLLDRGMNYDW